MARASSLMLSASTKVTFSVILETLPNFGPSSNQNYPVSELIDEMAKYWDHVRWNDVSVTQSHVHEAGLLKLNCDKALYDLDWRPSMQFSDTVKMTVEWYKYYYQNM